MSSRARPRCFWSGTAARDLLFPTEGQSPVPLPDGGFLFSPSGGCYTVESASACVLAARLRRSRVSDQKPDESFRVVDRRMFTAEGEVRDEAIREEKRREEETKSPSQPAAQAKPGGPAPAAPERPVEAAKPPAPEPPANEPKPSRGFQMLINFIAQNAAMLLGAYPDPRTGQPMLDLEGAREMIDMLDALLEATRGG